LSSHPLTRRRICSFLQRWITEYPGDFAAPGVAGALAALVKAVTDPAKKLHLLRYAAVFRPFLDRTLPPLVDPEAAWAKAESCVAEDTEDAYSISLSDEDTHGAPPAAAPAQPAAPAKDAALSPAPARPRAMSAIASTPPTPRAPEIPPKLLQDLLRVANELTFIPAPELAGELTNVCKEYFLQITVCCGCAVCVWGVDVSASASQPRDWLRTAFGAAKKGEDPVTKMVSFSNHCADWCVLSPPAAIAR
jgi:hypothetical protein